MKSVWVLLMLFAVTLVFSCKKGESDPGEGNNVPNTSDLNHNLLLQLVNDVRASGCVCGTTNMPAVAPVIWNDLLEDAAAHSVDMKNRNTLSHTGGDGSNPGDRIVAAGYNWTTFGENIAYNYPDESAVIQGWLQSEPHCRNIMNASVTEMGVARSGAYWTQIFGKR
jgi:uncharacterized protein YkwD